MAKISYSLIALRVQYMVILTEHPQQKTRMLIHSRHMHCKNIILILGNHDTHIRKNLRGEKDLFAHVSDYEELNVEGIGRFVLCHYPIISWNEMRQGVTMLHGHQHLKGDIKFGNGKRMDIGACGNDLRPYHLKEIMKIMNARPVHDLADDHH